MTFPKRPTFCVAFWGMLLLLLGDLTTLDFVLGAGRIVPLAFAIESDKRNVIRVVLILVWRLRMLSVRARREPNDSLRVSGS